jgi:hypothetical protein
MTGVLSGGLLVAAKVSAEVAVDPGVRAAMQCDHASEPGRVRCTVDVRVEAGATLAWTDVAIVSVPDFASALKGRIGPQDTLSRDPTSTKWALALVSRRAGHGEVRARVRGVVCEAQPSVDGGAAAAPPLSLVPVQRCVPITVVVTASVTVGG